MTGRPDSSDITVRASPGARLNVRDRLSALLLPGVILMISLTPPMTDTAYADPLKSMPMNNLINVPVSALNDGYRSGGGWGGGGGPAPGGGWGGDAPKTWGCTSSASAKQKLLQGSGGGGGGGPAGGC